MGVYRGLDALSAWFGVGGGAPSSSKAAGGGGEAAATHRAGHSLLSWPPSMGSIGIHPSCWLALHVGALPHAPS